MARGGRCRGGPREDEGEVPMLALLRMAEPSVRTTAAMPLDDDASTSLSARSYRRRAGGAAAPASDLEL